VPGPSGTHLKYLLMAKHNSMYIPLPMPPTTKEKYAVYLTIGREIEMFLYDGKQVFTPDFPDIPIDKFEIGDGRIIRQETLARICRYMMSQSVVEYNKEYKIWEAVLNEILDKPF
jgi:hypothetical protein